MKPFTLEWWEEQKNKAWQISLGATLCQSRYFANRYYELYKWIDERIEKYGEN